MNWMRTRRATALLAMTLTIPTTLGAQPRTPSTRLTIRVQRGPGVAMDDKTVRAVANEFVRLWSPYLEVSVRFSDVPASQSSSEQVRLVITNRVLPANQVNGIGWIQFVGTDPQPEITVSTTAALRLMWTGSVFGRSFAAVPPRLRAQFQQRALAMAAAHELGHYLLRTKTHARSGLMRPSFTVDEIMDGRPRDRRLDDSAVATLRTPRLLMVERTGQPSTPIE